MSRRKCPFLLTCCISLSARDGRLEESMVVRTIRPHACPTTTKITKMRSLTPHRGAVVCDRRKQQQTENKLSILAFPRLFDVKRVTEKLMTASSERVDQMLVCSIVAVIIICFFFLLCPLLNMEADITLKTRWMFRSSYRKWNVKA